MRPFSGRGIYVVSCLKNSILTAEAMEGTCFFIGVHINESIERSSKARIRRKISFGATKSKFSQRGELGEYGKSSASRG